MEDQQRRRAAALHGSAHRRATLTGGDGDVLVGIGRAGWAVEQPLTGLTAAVGDHVFAAGGRVSFTLTSSVLATGSGSIQPLGFPFSAGRSHSDAQRSGIALWLPLPLIYRRHALPWRDAPSLLDDARTCMYSVCWTPVHSAAAIPQCTGGPPNLFSGHIE